MSTTAGAVYYLTGSTWNAASAGGTGTDTNRYAGFLGVAMGSSANRGFVIDGVVRLSAQTGGSIGDPVYLSTSQGQLTTTQPGSGNIVRVCGYVVGSATVYFRPDFTWIKKT